MDRADLRLSRDHEWHVCIGIQAGRQCRPDRSHFDEGLILPRCRCDGPRLPTDTGDHRGRRHAQLGTVDPGLNAEFARRPTLIVHIHGDGDFRPQRETGHRRRSIDLHARHLSHDRSGILRGQRDRLGRVVKRTQGEQLLHQIGTFKVLAQLLGAQELWVSATGRRVDLESEQLVTIDARVVVAGGSPRGPLVAAVDEQR